MKESSQAIRERMDKIRRLREEFDDTVDKLDKSLALERVIPGIFAFAKERGGAKVTTQWVGKPEQRAARFKGDRRDNWEFRVMLGGVLHKTILAKQMELEDREILMQGLKK